MTDDINRSIGSYISTNYRLCKVHHMVKLQYNWTVFWHESFKHGPKITTTTATVAVHTQKAQCRTWNTSGETSQLSCLSRCCLLWHKLIIQVHTHSSSLRGCNRIGSCPYGPVQRDSECPVSLNSQGLPHLKLTMNAIYTQYRHECGVMSLNTRVFLEWIKYCTE